MSLRTVLVLAAAAAIAACSAEEASSAPSPSEESSQGSAASTEAPRQLAQLATPEENLEQAESYLAMNGAQEGVVTTPSGLQYNVLASGPADGVSPTPGQWVCVHYRGTFIDGEEFDSSYSRNQAAAFQSNGVIAGWVEALSLMKPGDAWRLAIHPNLAYGPQGRPGIPPNSLLLFDVELIRLLDGPPAGDCAES